MVEVRIVSGYNDPEKTASSVATVSATGLVTAKKVGTAKIAVKSGSQRKVVRVNVK